MLLLNFIGKQQLIINDTAPVNILSHDAPLSRPISFSATTARYEQEVVIPWAHFIKQRDARMQNIQVQPMDKYLDKYKQFEGNVHFDAEAGFTLVNKTSLFSGDSANQTAKFVQSGFLHVLNILQENYVASKFPNTQYKVLLSTKEFPSKAANNPIFVLIIVLVYPFYFCMSVMSIMSPFMVTLVTEKKTKLKAAMQMMVL